MGGRQPGIARCRRLRLGAPARREAAAALPRPGLSYGSAARRAQAPWLGCSCSPVTRCAAFVVACGATRQYGEPSWHRRARRARGEARVLLRLDAARARLAAHHSSAHGGMQRQRGRRGAHGGGGDGAAGQQAAAQQLLLSLLGGAFNGAHRGGKNGGRGQSSANQQRAGEWACPCGFLTNRPSRVNCFVCSRPRGAGGGQGKGLGQKGVGKGGDRPATAPARNAPAGRGGERKYDGPIGANGSRPLLGGRGQNPHRDGVVAGAGSPIKGGAWGKVQGKAPGKGSATAWMGDAGAAGKGPAEHVHGPWGKGVPESGKGTGRWVRPQQVADDEGFTLVQPRRMFCKGSADGTELQQSTDGGATAAGGGGRRWGSANSAAVGRRGRLRR